MTQSFDAIVIGAGQAAPPLAARIAGEGLTVALVERRHLGGSCVNFGCTPTKAMVASARAAWAARRAGEMGVSVGGDVRVDMGKVKARRDAIVAASRRSLRDWLEGAEGVTLVEGHARFTAPDRVRVGERELRAPRVFVNTGARGVVPDIPGLAETGFWTPSRVMDVDRVPRHLLVLGGGYVGVEFAQMFRRFGSEVTLVERGARLLEREDTDISEAVQQILEDEGVEVLVAAEATRVEAAGGGVAVTLERGGEPREVRGSDLLLGLGRRPNSDDLGLEAAGVDRDDRGYIRVDEGLRTNVEGIWALGDVNGAGAFTHTAYNDYQIVADRLFGRGERSLADRIPAHAVYIDPPLGRAGLNETETRASHRRVLLAKMPMDEVARAKEIGETRGFMKVLVDGDSGLLLGAAVLGHAGDEVVQGLMGLMYARAPYQVLRDAVGIHPTVSELIPSLLERLEPLPAPVERPREG
jgi:pyruvate/2-oxoglutarate dehydrogenase complex dihydrolipoamide dehydrogenase (E3) component